MFECAARAALREAPATATPAERHPPDPHHNSTGKSPAIWLACADMNSRRDQDRIQQYSELRRQLNTALRELRHHLADVAADVQKLHDVRRVLESEVEKKDRANVHDSRRSSVANGSPTTSNVKLGNNVAVQPLGSVNLLVSTMETIESEMQRLEVDSSYPRDLDFNESHIPRSVVVAVDPVLPDDDSDDGAQLPDILNDYFHTVGDISIIQETYHQELPAEYHDQLQDLQRRQDQGEVTPVTEQDLRDEYERRRAEVFAQLVAAQEKAQQLKDQCQANGISTNPQDYERMTESVSSDSGQHPYTKVYNWLDEVPDKQGSRVVSRRVSNEDFWSGSEMSGSRQSPSIWPISDYSLKGNSDFAAQTLDEPLSVSARPKSSKSKRQSGIKNNNMEHVEDRSEALKDLDISSLELESKVPVPSSHDSKLGDEQLRYERRLPDLMDYAHPGYHGIMPDAPNEFLDAIKEPISSEQYHNQVDYPHLGFEDPHTYPNGTHLLPPGTESKPPD